MSIYFALCYMENDTMCIMYKQRKYLSALWCRLVKVTMGQVCFCSTTFSRASLRRVVRTAAMVIYLFIYFSSKWRYCSSNLTCHCFQIYHRCAQLSQVKKKNSLFNLNHSSFADLHVNLGNSKQQWHNNQYAKPCPKRKMHKMASLLRMSSIFCNIKREFSQIFTETEKTVQWFGLFCTACHSK